MINMPIEMRSEVMDVLDRIRAFTNQHPKLQASNSKIEVEKNGFQQMLSGIKSALTDVDHTQQHADTIKNQYLSGEKNVTLSDVLITSEKSKIAFEGLIAVRNKFLEAYKEIMNIPI